MTPRSELRLAGFAAAVGAVLFAVASFVQLLDLLGFLDLFGDSENLAATALYVRTLLASIGELLVALGLVGLCARQSEVAGVLGLVGFVLAFLGIALIRVAYLSVLFADLGLALFGLASLRANLYPRPAALLLFWSALIREVFNPNVAIGPGAELGYVGAGAGVALGAAVAWLGLSVLTERGQEAIGGANCARSRRTTVFSPGIREMFCAASVSRPAPGHRCR